MRYDFDHMPGCLPTDSVKWNKYNREVLTQALERMKAALEKTPA